MVFKGRKGSHPWRSASASCLGRPSKPNLLTPPRSCTRASRVPLRRTLFTRWELGRRTRGSSVSCGLSRRERRRVWRERVGWGSFWSGRARQEARSLAPGPSHRDVCLCAPLRRYPKRRSCVERVLACALAPDEGRRVHLLAVAEHFKVHMRASGTPARAHERNALAATDRLAHRDQCF